MQTALLNKPITVFTAIAAAVFISGSSFSQQAETAPEKNRGSKIEYASGSLRDPFGEPKIKIEEPEEEIQPMPELTVQGLVWGSSMPQAIINDKVFKLGDSIEGAKIVEINREGVVLVRGNNKYKLSSPAIIGPRGAKDSAPKGGTYETKN